jgi:hypothetical protein
MDSKAELYKRHEFGAILGTPKANRHMEVALSGVHVDMYPIVAPFDLRSGIALFSPSNLSIRPSLDSLQYRISDEGANNECFHDGACGDPHGCEQYRK